MLKLVVLTLFLAGLTACSGAKVKKNPPQSQQPAPPSKQGMTMGSGALGRSTVDTGFWCEVRATSAVTFGDSGPSEQVATENARKKCRDMYGSSACELQFCKPNR